MQKQTISFEDFTKIDIRVGIITEVNDFPKAIKPSYKLKIDFGNGNIKNSSAQITALYSKKELLEKQVVAIVNFNPKQIANYSSQCLVLGIQEGNNVILLKNQKFALNGTQVS